MQTTERITAKQLESEYGITVRSEFVPYSKSRSFKPDATPGTKSLNWRVTLVKDGRDVLTTDYTAGIGHAPSWKNYNPKTHGMRESMLHSSFLDHEAENGTEAKLAMSHGPIVKGAPILPDACDVLYSLVMGGSAIDYPTFEDWASDYGYEEDSRKGEATYRECLQTGLTLRAALGETTLAKLRDAFQDF